MDLVRDLLDTLVMDRNGREMGRVDGIVLELRDGVPPRVARIELGGAVLAWRIHPVLARWAEGLEHAIGIGDGQPRRVPFSEILSIDDHVRVDVGKGS